LALTQTKLFIESLREVHPNLDVDYVVIETEGDVSTAPLSNSTNPGLFASALRDALLAGEVDLIVHSLKDLPAAPFPGISTACIPRREDSRDALVSNGNLRVESLPAGARVGTSSPRRAAAIRRARPDLVVADIRGNVDTRIAKVRSGDYDATILALAGLRRIGRETEIAEILDIEFLTPAPGQGALSIECREDDDAVRSLLAPLDDVDARITVAAERALLVGLQAGCATPIGGHAVLDGSTVTLRAELSTADGANFVSITDTVALSDEPIAGATGLGLDVARVLRDSPAGIAVNPL
jgi:hydroxymethylbilane synthase